MPLAAGDFAELYDRRACAVAAASSSGSGRPSSSIRALI
jgi:hypothetical protein